MVTARSDDQERDLPAIILVMPDVAGLQDDIDIAIAIAVIVIGVLEVVITVVVENADIPQPLHLRRPLVIPLSSQILAKVLHNHYLVLPELFLPNVKVQKLTSQERKLLFRLPVRLP